MAVDPTGRPRPLRSLPAAQARGIRGVLTDIDDTLTTDGAITADALRALERLKAAGLHVAAITGRPMGWSEPFAAAWPIDAIVAENGGVALIRSGTGLSVEFSQDEATRALNTRRLQEVAARIAAEVPGAQPARDSAGRVTDIAIDHSEYTQLPGERIEQVVAIMRGAGMRASVSSIHINGWFGDHDKLSGAQWIAQRLYGVDLMSQAPQWAYVGDSTNDQALFAALPLTVGVANLMRFAPELTHWPAYIATRERGAGFAECVDRLLALRAAS